VYKPSITCVIADALSILPNNIKPKGVHDQTTGASLFYTRPKWLNDVK